LCSKEESKEERQIENKNPSKNLGHAFSRILGTVFERAQEF